MGSGPHFYDWCKHVEYTNHFKIPTSNARRVRIYPFAIIKSTKDNALKSEKLDLNLVFNNTHLIIYLQLRILLLNFMRHT
jgi:hypothetical protein